MNEVRHLIPLGNWRHRASKDSVTRSVTTTFPSGGGCGSPLRGSGAHTRTSCFHRDRQKGRRCSVRAGRAPLRGQAGRLDGERRGAERHTAARYPAGGERPHGSRSAPCHLQARQPRPGRGGAQVCKMNKSGSGRRHATFLFQPAGRRSIPPSRQQRSRG